MRRLILFLVWLLCLTVSTLPQSSQTKYPVAPAFVLKDLKGRLVRLSDYKGKVVLLNFWATWCPPCRAEMPDLVKLQAEYQDRGLQIVGLTYPPYRQKAMRQIARDLKLNYPLLLGTRAFAAKYEVGEVLPATIVIDREGKIHARILGILKPEEFEQHVSPLLY